MRQTHKLSEIEFKQFRALGRQPFPNVAWGFWRRVASVRGLDPATLISNGSTFTALPLNHGKAWCFPIPLKCTRRPVYKD